MSGKMAKSQVPTVAESALPGDVRMGLIEAKNRVKSGAGLTPFNNRKDKAEATGPPLPDEALGCGYFEFDVGQAHPGDARPRGKKRLVFEIDRACRQIREIYYSDEHYGKFSFKRVV